LTDTHDTGRHETDLATLEPVADRLATAKAATTALIGAMGVDAETRHELVLAALVALMDSVSDVPVLLRARRAARLRAADLAAAGRATLAADRDGEPDPLYYLRDQLDHDQADDPDADQASAVPR